MKKIETLRLIRLGNAEHTHFHKRIYGAVEAANIPELQVGLPAYGEALMNEDALQNKPTRLHETRTLTEINSELTAALMSLSHYLKSCKYHWNPNMVEAANRVLIVLRYFRRDLQGNRQRKSEAVVQLLQDLGETNYRGVMMDEETIAGSTPSADAQLLGLEPWVSRLKTLNQDLIHAINHRSQTYTAYAMQGDAVLLRRKTDRMYRLLMGHLQLLIQVNGMAAYERLVAHLNVIVVDFRTTIKLRETIAKKQRLKKQAEKEKATQNEGEE